MLWLWSSTGKSSQLKCNFQEFPGKKNGDFYPAGLFFLMLQVNLYEGAQISRKLPALKNSLLLALEICIFFGFTIALYDCLLQKTSEILLHQGQCHIRVVDENYFLYLGIFVDIRNNLQSLCLLQSQYETFPHLELLQVFG